MVLKVLRPSNVLVALSVLACVAVAALWARGYWRYDLLGCRFGTTGWILGSYRGHLLWAKAPADRGEGGAEWYGHESGTGMQAALVWECVRANAAWNVAGFSYTGNVDRSWPVRVLITPLWSLALLLGALPCRRLLRSRRRRTRLRGNLCPACGYDLRATPGRCPECGHRPAAAATAVARAS
jgi:hypothetical protein